MENIIIDDVITIRPTMRYALLKIGHLLILALVFLGAAWYLLPGFILLSIGLLGIAFYRLLSIRAIAYHLTDEVMQIQTGICFKRVDHLELYRVKDYVIYQGLMLQILGLMNLELLTTDLSAPFIILRGIPKSDLLDVIRERVQLARQRNKIVELN